MNENNHFHFLFSGFIKSFHNFLMMIIHDAVDVVAIVRFDNNDDLEKKVVFSDDDVIIKKRDYFSSNMNMMIRHINSMAIKP